MGKKRRRRSSWSCAGFPLSIRSISRWFVPAVGLGTDDRNRRAEQASHGPPRVL
uniref:Uncharacterized protein n=1 Tax=Arundo donax TaxID=35708 RepID=A0A0A8YN11_ARUDO